jgi:hypothetical protein
VEVAVAGERKPVRPVGVLAHDRNLAGGIKIVSLADPDIGEIEAALGGPDRSFGEDEIFLDQFGHCAARQYAGAPS